MVIQLSDYRNFKRELLNIKFDCTETQLGAWRFIQLRLSRVKADLGLNGSKKQKNNNTM